MSKVLGFCLLDKRKKNKASRTLRTVSLLSCSLINPNESANHLSIERLVSSTEGGKSILRKVKVFRTSSDSGNEDKKITKTQGNTLFPLVIVYSKVVFKAFELEKTR